MTVPIEAIFNVLNPQPDRKQPDADTMMGAVNAYVSQLQAIIRRSGDSMLVADADVAFFDYLCDLYGRPSEEAWRDWIEEGEKK